MDEEDGDLLQHGLGHHDGGKEPFKVPKDKKGKKLRTRHWTEEQTSRSEANSKVIAILIDLLPPNVISGVGKYENAHELWSKVKKFPWEEFLATLEEEEKEKSEETDVVAQEEEVEQPEVKPCSTSEEDKEDETSSTKVEEQSKTSEEEVLEVNLVSTSTEAKSKDHIICFGCNEKGHYKSRCLRVRKRYLLNLIQFL